GPGLLRTAGADGTARSARSTGAARGSGARRAAGAARRDRPVRGHAGRPRGSGRGASAGSPRCAGRPLAGRGARGGGAVGVGGAGGRNGRVRGPHGSPVVDASWPAAPVIGARRPVFSGAVRPRGPLPAGARTRTGVITTAEVLGHGLSPGAVENREASEFGRGSNGTGGPSGLMRRGSHPGLLADQGQRAFGGGADPGIAGVDALVQVDPPVDP